MRANGWRLVASLLWIVAANALVVWWFAGDIEMGWILAMLLVPAAGFLIGAVGAALLRYPRRAALTPLALSPALAVLLLVVAIQTTPYARSLDATPELRAAADSLAAGRAALQAEARRITGIPVEIGAPDVVITPGRLLKEGFRLRLTREEPAATVAFTFAAGPRRRMTFDVIHDDDGWRARPRDPDLFAAHPEIELTRAYLERRFPGREATLDAGWPGYTRGDTVLILLRRAGGDAASAAGRDLEFVVFRLGEEDELLREVRRYSGDEVFAHFTRAASAAGLGRLRSLRFVRPPNRLQDPSFGFLGELDGGARRIVWLAAIRRGEGVEFTVADPAP